MTAQDHLTGMPTPGPLRLDPNDETTIVDKNGSYVGDTDVRGSSLTWEQRVAWAALIVKAVNAYSSTDALRSALAEAEVALRWAIKSTADKLEPGDVSIFSHPLETVRAALSGSPHASDCAVHNGPALPAGECDCDVSGSPAPSTEGLREALPFQDRVRDWTVACFGSEISDDKIERNHRFLEEALELVQALSCTKAEAHALVDYVYGRSVGEPTQELGGVMVTLAALSNANGFKMAASAETELARCYTKIEKIRAKQAAKPKHSPLPEHVAAPDAALTALAGITAPSEVDAK